MCSISPGKIHFTRPSEQRDLATINIRVYVQQTIIPILAFNSVILSTHTDDESFEVVGRVKGNGRGERGWERRV